MKIQDILGLRIKPTAVQARFGGAKGMVSEIFPGWIHP
jgi:hypothetical protein